METLDIQKCKKMGNSQTQSHLLTQFLSFFLNFLYSKVIIKAFHLPVSNNDFQLAGKNKSILASWHHILSLLFPTNHTKILNFDRLEWWKYRSENTWSIYWTNMSPCIFKSILSPFFKGQNWKFWFRWKKGDSGLLEKGVSSPTSD